MKEPKPESVVAIRGVSYPVGKPRRVLIKVPVQIVLTMNEGRAADHTLVTTRYTWAVYFNGREVRSSKKSAPTEAKAMRAALRGVREYARRQRELVRP